MNPVRTVMIAVSWDAIFRSKLPFYEGSKKELPPGQIKIIGATPEPPIEHPAVDQWQVAALWEWVTRVDTRMVTVLITQIAFQETAAEVSFFIALTYSPAEFASDETALDLLAALKFDEDVLVEPPPLMPEIEAIFVKLKA